MTEFDVKIEARENSPSMIEEEDDVLDAISTEAIRPPTTYCEDDEEEGVKKKKPADTTADHDSESLVDDIGIRVIQQEYKKELSGNEEEDIERMQQVIYKQVQATAKRRSDSSF